MIALEGDLLVVHRDELTDDRKFVIFIYGLLAIDVSLHDRELHSQIILKLIDSKRITLLSHGRI